MVYIIKLLFNAAPSFVAWQDRCVRSNFQSSGEKKFSNKNRTNFHLYILIFTNSNQTSLLFFFIFIWVDFFFLRCDCNEVEICCAQSIYFYCHWRGIKKSRIKMKYIEIKFKMNEIIYSPWLIDFTCFYLVEFIVTSKIETNSKQKPNWTQFISSFR